MPDTSKSIDKSFTAKLSLTFTGDDSGKIWNALEITDAGLDPAELAKFAGAVVPGVTKLMTDSALSALAAGVASGEVG